MERDTRSSFYDRVRVGYVRSRGHAAARERADGPYSAGETARLLGVHIDTVRDWCASGELACFRTAGGHRRITAKAIDEMLAKRLSEAA